MTARMRLSRRDRGRRWTPPKLATDPNKSETNIARIARSGPNRGNQYKFVSYMYVLFPSAGARHVPKARAYCALTRDGSAWPVITGPVL